MGTYMNTYIKNIISKIVSLVIAVAIMATALVGCGEEATATNTSIRTYTTEGKETKLVGDPDLTGELTIATTYIDVSAAKDPLTGDTLTQAEILFNELYPNIKLNIIRLDPNENIHEYISKLSTTIMAGNGPDILIYTSDLGHSVENTLDIYKISKSGSLVDLFDYFEKDKNFNISDYNEKVFYGSQINGKQFMVPISYEFPAILTTQSNIDKFNLDLSKCNDYEGCIKQLGGMLEKSENEKPKKTASRIASNMMFFSGLSFVDYENATIHLNDAEIKKYYELQKKYFSDYAGIDYPFLGGVGGDGDRLLSGMEVLVDQMLPFNEGLKSMEVVNKKEKAVMIPWRDVNGKIPALALKTAAITNNCNNKQLAYEFIKILISKETSMKDIRMFGMGIPICNAAVEPAAASIINLFNQEDKNTLLSEKSKKNVNTMINFIEDIEGVSPASHVYSIMYMEMLPYLKDEKSYEECIQSAQSKLEIYISE